MSERRTQRLEGEFRRALGEIFLTGIKDPGFSHMAGVTRVEITPDLQFAKVYVSVYDEPEKRTQTIDALKRAEGFLRAKLNERIKVRRIPELHFVLDDSIEYSIRLSKLIDEVNKGLKPDEE